ncbi:hypothetical protein WJX84_005595 [Apatococcus fuscideae]|uniref:Uncharacterized protein n=1 Tax=Apatococcus fuscideae TaxID=2026836 RepID=A0AAW1T677_9CHLO
MDDVTSWQLMGTCDFGTTLRETPLRPQVDQGTTLIPQPRTSCSVDDIVNAAVGRVEAAQHLLIGSIDDGPRCQSCDVPLPEAEPGPGNLLQAWESTWVDNSSSGLQFLGQQLVKVGVELL